MIKMNRYIVDYIMIGLILAIIIGYIVHNTLCNFYNKKKKECLVKHGYRRELLNSQYQYGYVKKDYETITEDELEGMSLQEVLNKFKRDIQY